MQRWSGQIDKDLGAVAPMLIGRVNVPVTLDWRSSMRAQHVLGLYPLCAESFYAAHMPNVAKQC